MPLDLQPTIDELTAKRDELSSVIDGLLRAQITFGGPVRDAVIVETNARPARLALPPPLSPAERQRRSSRSGPKTHRPKTVRRDKVRALMAQVATLGEEFTTADALDACPGLKRNAILYNFGNLCRAKALVKTSNGGAGVPLSWRRGAKFSDWLGEAETPATAAQVVRKERKTRQPRGSREDREAREEETPSPPSRLRGTSNAIPELTGRTPRENGIQAIKNVIALAGRPLSGQEVVEAMQQAYPDRAETDAQKSAIRVRLIDLASVAEIFRSGGGPDARYSQSLEVSSIPSLP